MCNSYLIGEHVQKAEYSFVYDVPSNLEKNNNGDAYLLIFRNHLSNCYDLSTNLFLNKNKHLILSNNKGKYFLEENKIFPYKFYLIKLNSIHTNFNFNIIAGYTTFCFPCIIKDVMMLNNWKIITFNQILPYFILKGKTKYKKLKK